MFKETAKCNFPSCRMVPINIYTYVSVENVPCKLGKEAL